MQMQCFIFGQEFILLLILDRFEIENLHGHVKTTGLFPSQNGIACSRLSTFFRLLLLFNVFRLLFAIDSFRQESFLFTLSLPFVCSKLRQ